MTTEVNLTIGRNIYRLRAYRGMQQKQFASVMGVSVQTISNWENGKVDFKQCQLQRICDKLEATYHELIANEAASKLR